MRGSRRRRAARYADAVAAEAQAAHAESARAAERAWSAWEADLDALAALAADDRCRRFLQSTSIPLAERLSAAQRAAGDALSARGLGLLRLLAEQRALDLTREIARRVRAAADEAQQVDRVHVTAAVDLHGEELDELRAQLTTPGRTLRLTTDTDPALLGGFVVRRGDDILDVSVRARLHALASTLR